MPGEEVFLRGLYELVSGDNQHKISMNVCGRDGSVQSRAFMYFIDHIMENFSHLMCDNLSWWFRNGFIKESAESIKKKVDLATDDDEEVGMFVDCNCLETFRCGGGPAEQGANAARWDPDIQRSLYNGWKSITGLKHQTIDIAHGFCIDLHGPTSVRRNDLTLFRLSDINGRVAAENGADSKYIIFGDSAYKRFSHTRSYYPVDGVDNHRRWNSRMKSVRISIEWNYANTASLFKYVSNKRKLQLLQSDTVTKVYHVATFFRNLHIGLYGCQSSIRHNFVPHYLHQTDF
jgi:DDE superfamily endonuclease